MKVKIPILESIPVWISSAIGMSFNNVPIVADTLYALFAIGFFVYCVVVFTQQHKTVPAHIQSAPVEQRPSHKEYVDTEQYEVVDETLQEVAQ